MILLNSYKLILLYSYVSSNFFISKSSSRACYYSISKSKFRSWSLSGSGTKHELSMPMSFCKSGPNKFEFLFYNFYHNINYFITYDKNKFTTNFKGN